MLLILTLIINFITLAMALWLGLYVVTRSPRSLIAWLTGFTLWSIAGLFMNVLLALNPPPELTTPPIWISYFLPFWHTAAFKEQAAHSWLAGWSVTLSIVLWHHVTMLMRPGRLTPWRWMRVLAGYGIAIAAIFIQVYTPLLFTSVSGDPLYLNAIKAGPLYAGFALLMLLFTGMSVTNLARSAHNAPATMPRKQLIVLAVATVTGGLAGPLFIAASAFGLPVPIIIISILLGIAVALTGYGVARYSALVNGRTIRRDFTYNAVAIGLVAVLYLLIIWLLIRTYNIPTVTIFFVVIMAIITHSLIDIIRRGLDTIFYREKTRQLRENLRQLARRAGEQADQDGNLALALDSMCASVHAKFGLLTLCENNQLRLAATYRWHGSGLHVNPGDLAADDILPLEPGYFAPPLAEAALLIPLHAETEQLGALILGQPVNSTHYSQADIELLLYPSDRIADAIQNIEREGEYLDQIAALVEKNQPAIVPTPTDISVKAVEDALRNLSNYAHLGEHPLAKTKLVKARLLPGTVTHLDRGKAVYRVVAEAVEKLRPDGGIPADPPPREWYPYLILQSAYLEDVPNRDIMSRLYISEGTFNRTRRAALRAVTQALEEMEIAAK